MAADGDVVDLAVRAAVAAEPEREMTPASGGPPDRFRTGNNGRLRCRLMCWPGLRQPSSC